MTLILIKVLTIVVMLMMIVIIITIIVIVVVVVVVVMMIIITLDGVARTVLEPASASGRIEGSQLGPERTRREIAFFCLRWHP